ncbi:MAG: hypothetical protein CND43_03540 [Flavobacteriales bacterium MED-G15]|nr:MAG: hypothetical protein CND43_03540 [Flavobacteriales bacterium MED-G15]|tara:strand:+ start:10437 stop:11897 length:1461 start_codon:yes stop_codon:yes gene_type:complete
MNQYYLLSSIVEKYTQYPNTWDEMFTRDGQVRPLYNEFGKYLESSPIERLGKMQEFSRQFFMNQGVTFTVYNNNKGVERIFPFDIIPRIIQEKEWKIIEQGIIQRIKALNFFLKDIYHEQFIIKDRVVPANLIVSHPNYIRGMRNLSVPKNIYTHISGVDLIRNSDGAFYVLEDNLRTPSGVSYMLENREITRRLYPKLMPKKKVMPISNYPQLLYDQLKTLVDIPDPEIVLLTPGLYNAAYYEHSTLARLMGVELVEGSDLVLNNHNVYMKTAGGLKKIDVIYRRIDDDYLDPLNFNADSVLGLAGIMESYRQGNVVIVNAPGTGVADDKAVYTYIPEIINYYLNEAPILNNIKTFQLGNADEKDYVIKNIDRMVVKKTDGSGGYGMLMGKSASEKEIEAYIKKIEAKPDNFIAQPTLSLSTTPCIIDNELTPRCVDLRPFAVFGANGIKVCPGGLSRVALKKMSLVVNSSQGGGSKDTWVTKDN